MQKKNMSFFSDKIPCLCSPKAPPPCPLNTTIFLFIYIISSLCLKQRKKMEHISEKKNFPIQQGKKRKKSCRNVEFWGLWRCRILSKKMCRNEENVEKNL
jgi:hypothetical protein